MGAMLAAQRGPRTSRGWAMPRHSQQSSRPVQAERSLGYWDFSAASAKTCMAIA
jgi:hypothetical protein